MAKCLPTMQETQVQSLGQEDRLEKEMATHSSILVGKSHEQGSLVGYSPWGHKESDMTERVQFLLGNELGLMYVIEMCVQTKVTKQGTHLRWKDSPGARSPFLRSRVARFSKNQTKPNQQKHPVPWLHLNFG